MIRKLYHFWLDVPLKNHCRGQTLNFIYSNLIFPLFCSHSALLNNWIPLKYPSEPLTANVKSSLSSSFRPAALQAFVFGIKTNKEITRKRRENIAKNRKNKLGGVLGLTQGKVSEIMKIKLLWLRLRVALVFQSVSSVQTCFAVFFFSKSQWHKTYYFSYYNNSNYRSMFYTCLLCYLLFYYLSLHVFQ